jgi:hypothetical protein
MLDKGFFFVKLLLMAQTFAAIYYAVLSSKEMDNARLNYIP